MKKHILKPIEKKGDEVILIPASNELNSDWLHAFRLTKKSKAGDKKAKKELERMDKTDMITIEKGANNE